MKNNTKDILVSNFTKPNQRKFENEKIYIYIQNKKDLKSSSA